MDMTVLWLILVSFGALWLLTAKSAYTHGELHAVTLGALFPVYAVAPIVFIYHSQEPVSVQVALVGAVAGLAAVFAGYVSFDSYLKLSPKYEALIVKSGVSLCLIALTVVFWYSS